MPPRSALSPIATASAALLLAWFGLNFIGVPRLVDAEPLLSLAGLMLAVLALLVIGGMRRWPATAALTALALLIWLALQVETHWWTYLVAEASERRLAWYARSWGHLLAVLPERPGHTRPDLYHTVLAVLVLATLLLAVRDAWRARRRRP